MAEKPPVLALWLVPPELSYPVAAAVLACGYLGYGRWLANKWGVDKEALTPAKRMKDGKSFYMKQNADGKTVAAADMLVPGIGELIGGSQREEDYDKLVTRMDELGLDKSSYDWYLNLRKFGGVEHAGYGLGFERMIMYLTGIQNIRDVLPFPRTAYGF